MQIAPINYPFLKPKPGGGHGLRRQWRRAIGPAPGARGGFTHASVFPSSRALQKGDRLQYRSDGGGDVGRVRGQGNAGK